MNIFKDYKLKWWEIGLFKLSLISLGVIIGINFSRDFESLLPLLWILFLIPGLYLLYIWHRQKG